MSYSTVLAQIKSIMEGVASIGVVHDYERWSNDWPTFLSHFKPSGVSLVKGWTITRQKTSERWDESIQVLRAHTFIIRGYHSLDDSEATEKTFQALIDTVMTTFRPTISLSSTAELAGPMQLDIVEHRMFGATLCHYCELRIVAEERVKVTGIG